MSKNNNKKNFKEIREFIDGLKMKKMKAGEIAEDIVYIQSNLVGFYIAHAHKVANADLVKELHEKMIHPKFPKALTKIMKAAKKESGFEPLDLGFAVIIAEFLEKNRNNENLTDEVKTEYADIINELLKKRSKKIAKKSDVNIDVVKELLVITPDVGYISNDRFVGIYSQKMLRKLYYFANKVDTGIKDIDQIKVLFEKIFDNGDDEEKSLLDLIAVNILLEKKENLKAYTDEAQIKMWNLMTDFALNTIENQKKKHIAELVEYYCKRREADAKKERDSARRINLNTINAEQYPKFAKVVAKFSENGKPALTKYL